MFCQKCGSELDADAVVCPKCGCPTEKFAEKKNPEPVPEKVSAWSVILSILIPICGIVLGIIKLCQRQRSGWTYLTCGFISWGIAALIVSSLSI